MRSRIRQNGKRLIMRGSRKSKLVSVAALCVCLVHNIFLLAQSRNNASPSPTANALAQRALTALGGADLFSGVGITATGTLAVYGNNPTVLPIVIKSRGTNQIRSELTTK